MSAGLAGFTWTKGSNLSSDVISLRLSALWGWGADTIHSSTQPPTRTSWVPTECSVLKAESSTVNRTRGGKTLNKTSRCNVGVWRNDGTRGLFRVTTRAPQTGWGLGDI